MEVLDLQAGHRVVRGDPTVLSALPSFDASRLPLWEAENLLRNRLVTLLEGRPEGRPVGEELRRVLYQSAKAILAGVDARLICRGLYATRYRDKVARFATFATAEELALAERALAVKVDAAGDDSIDPAAFWAEARDFWVASLLELFASAWPRCRRLESIRRTIHFRSVAPTRTLRGIARLLMGGDACRELDRFLLDLVADEQQSAGDRRRETLARAAGVERAGASWSDDVRAGIRRWYSLRKEPQP